jgi:hypothetical protein
MCSITAYLLWNEKRERKRRKKGTKKRAENRNVHSSLFSALFCFLFFSDIIQYCTLDLDFLDLHPFSMLKLKRGGKSEEKQWEYKKGSKKGAKKEEKKATVNDPIVKRATKLDF